MWDKNRNRPTGDFLFTACLFLSHVGVYSADHSRFLSGTKAGRFFCKFLIHDFFHVPLSLCTNATVFGFEWLIEFSDIALSGLTLSRLSIFPDVSLNRPEGWQHQRKSEETAEGCVNLKTVAEIRRSSARDTFVAESVYLLLDSL